MNETVVNDERMSVGTAAEMSSDPSRTFTTAPEPINEVPPPSTRDSTLEAIQSAGVPDEIVQGAMTWFKHGSEQSQAELDVIDARDMAAAETELRQLWPGDKYEKNMGAIDKYLDQLPAGEGELIKHTRVSGGMAMCNDPATMVCLSALASKPRPDLGSGSLDMQIQQMESFMRNNRKAYDRDESVQQRYRELLTMKESGR